MKSFKIKNIITFSILLLLLPVFTANAQVGAEILTDIQGDPYFQGNQKETEGSPILYDGWLFGNIVNKQGTVYEDREVRFDTYKHNLHLNQEDGYLILNTEQLQKVEIPSLGLVFLNGYQSEEHNITKNQFVEVLHRGTIDLIIHHNTKLVESRRTNPITGDNSDKYITQTKYYLIDSDGTYHEVKKLKDKHLLKNLDNQMAKKLESYADEEDLSFKDKSDIKKIFEHYESLASYN